MKPKGWRLDPAWVEHYSKIDRERIEREIERVKLFYQMEQGRLNMEVARRNLLKPGYRIV